MEGGNSVHFTRPLDESLVILLDLPLMLTLVSGVYAVQEIVAGVAAGAEALGSISPKSMSALVTYALLATPKKE